MATTYPTRTIVKGVLTALNRGDFYATRMLCDDGYCIECKDNASTAELLSGMEYTTLYLEHCDTEDIAYIVVSPDHGDCPIVEYSTNIKSLLQLML